MSDASLFDALISGNALKVMDELFPQGPQQPMPGNPALVERPSPCDDAGTAGVVYPVTCRARYYGEASRILEEEGQLFTHDNANELGALIEQWINDARDNWEPK